MIFFNNKVRPVFVPKFFHNKRAENFLNYVEYVGEYGSDNVRCEYSEAERKYYEYKKSTSGSSVKSLLITDSDWPFPETYYKSIGSTVRGFVFFSWFTEKFHPIITKFNQHWIWKRRNDYHPNTIFILSRPAANWRKYKKLQKCPSKLFYKWEPFFVW